jgi:hypothetical protein
MKTSGSTARPCLRRTGRHDQDRAARDADQAGRDAAEERDLEGATAARADDDQLGVLLVGDLGETLGGHTDAGATLGVDEAGSGDDFLEQTRGVLLLRLRLVPHGVTPSHPAERGGGAVGDVRRLGDVGDDEP